jgi:anti-anti-sigma regulatory factor
LRWRIGCTTLYAGALIEATLKIEKDSHGRKTTIRLIGHFQSEHLGELKKQLQGNGSQFVLDLKEVTVVDVDVVRLLEACEANGVKIVHCSPYIRKWMDQERKMQR